MTSRVRGLSAALLLVATACSASQAAVAPTTAAPEARLSLVAPAPIEARVLPPAIGMVRSPSPSTETAVRHTWTPTEGEAFEVAVRSIDAEIASRMSESWRESCPVPLEDLRLLEIPYLDFAGGVSQGELVVHRDVAEEVASVFHLLYLVGYPIQRMELVDAYGADDTASMEANNTSAFNCRTVAGTNRWSEHAYGRAIDINPLVNPYVRGSYVSPDAGAEYADRSVEHAALITAEDEVVQAFRAIGWEWGGYWSSAKDYQHFSESGR